MVSGSGFYGTKSMVKWIEMVKKMDVKVPGTKRKTCNNSEVDFSSSEVIAWCWEVSHESRDCAFGELDEGNGSHEHNYSEKNR